MHLNATHHTVKTYSHELRGSPVSCGLEDASVLQIDGQLDLVSILHKGKPDR